MGERIDIEGPDGATVEAYLTAGAQGGPGVLLCMDAIGLRPRLEEMADEIASWGHTVLVPNLFHRFGVAADLAPDGDLTAPGAREAFFEGAMQRVHGYTAEQAVADTRAGVAALRARGVTGPLGVHGYCMGAAVAVRAAGDQTDDVAACGGFHGGGLVTDAEDSPHRTLATARARFAFGHADQDSSMPPEAVAELGRTLETLGLDAVNEVYAGAGHGYTMADTSVYDADATARHFRTLRDLYAPLRG
jgi:carboxymethylenebutenolidase